jgi:Uma2 family endonuclease
MALTVADLEKLQTDFPDYQMELVEGKILVMGPSDVESSEIGCRLIRFLGNWVDPRKLGRVFDSSGGFILHNADLRAPDVSFVRADRLRQSQRQFAQLVPDLVVEIKSKSDRLQPIREKIQLFLDLGAQVAILIDPDQRTVTVYDAQQAPLVLKSGDVLTLPTLLPGWSVEVAELWPPIFE